jgi:hypothetical protein
MLDPASPPQASISVNDKSAVQKEYQSTSLKCIRSGSGATSGSSFVDILLTFIGNPTSLNMASSRWIYPTASKCPSQDFNIPFPNHFHPLVKTCLIVKNAPFIAHRPYK